ncbi:MAG TPA: hypothetical protein VGK21_01400, partial [Candidatus Angelobacter sp.]
MAALPAPIRVVALPLRLVPGFSIAPRLHTEYLVSHDSDFLDDKLPLYPLYWPNLTANLPSTTTRSGSP